MSNPAIKVEGLGKEYIIGGAEFMATTFREMLTDAFTAPFKRFSKLSGRASEAERFWALKDVSFDIQQGEVVGIIGRNGAGKSTLLKILCRITAPTRGRIELEGRVASLLEVGTGFHPELTGRENIYLNGAILGMKQAEIKRKFDEIVDFAEIEKFLDTPVKRYSSGMYVRLAFAVAAHLEPEILLVDEVLAVGDIAFQKKCLGKMESVAEEGRTVMFVSHNLPMVRTLCQKGIFLDKGCVIIKGEMEEVIHNYLESLFPVEQNLLWERKNKNYDRSCITRVALSGVSKGIGNSEITTGCSVTFTFEISGRTPVSSCIFTIYDEYEQPVSYFDSSISVPGDDIDLSVNRTITCTVDPFLLSPGRYKVNVGLKFGGELLDRVESALVFSVEPGLVAGRPVSEIEQYGKVSLPHQWRTLCSR